MGASDYWREVGAPKLRELLVAYKEQSRTKINNSEIASQVETRSGKKTGRVAFEHFVNGVREPYVSQLVAISEILHVDLSELLQKSPTPIRRPLLRGALTHTNSEKLRKPYRAQRTK